MSSLRSLLILLRPASLVTVWSNCLAAWWLGGGGNPSRLPLLFAGATLLYLGGTLFSRAFEPCSGCSQAGAAGGAFTIIQRWGLGLMLLGVALLFGLGTLVGLVGLGLPVSIVACHLTPLPSAVSIMLPALCRLLVYVIAAAAALHGVGASAIGCGLALAAYVAGVGLFARQERLTGPARFGPIFLLLVPILLALILDTGARREAGLLLSAVLALWTARSLRPALWSAERDFAGAVSALTAGIVFVDLLAAADAPKPVSLIFLVLFGATRLLQQLPSSDATDAN